MLWHLLYGWEQVIKSRLWLSTVIAFVPVLASQKVVDFVSVLTESLALPAIR